MLAESTVGTVSADASRSSLLPAFGFLSDGAAGSSGELGGPDLRERDSDTELLLNFPVTD